MKHAISTLLTALILVGTIVDGALAATVKTFEIKNTSTTAANDLTISVNGALVPAIRPKPNPTTAPEVWSDGKDTGTKWVAGSPGQSQIKLCSVAPCPTTGNGTLNEGDSIKITLRGENKIGINPRSTFFTLNGDKIEDSAQVVSADPNLEQRGDRAVVSVSNDTHDYFFLSSVEIWTGLTESQAEDYVATEMTTPAMTASDKILAPGTVDFLDLGMMIPGYVLMLYDFASGPTSQARDALSEGRFVYAATVPEPGTLALIGCGLVGFGVTRRRQQHAGDRLDRATPCQ